MRKILILTACLVLAACGREPQIETGGPAGTTPAKAPEKAPEKTPKPAEPPKPAAQPKPVAAPAPAKAEAFDLDDILAEFK